MSAQCKEGAEATSCCKCRVAAFLGNLAGALFIVWLVDRTLLFREESQDPSFSGTGLGRMFMTLVYPDIRPQTTEELHCGGLLTGLHDLKGVGAFTGQLRPGCVFIMWRCLYF